MILIPSNKIIIDDDNEIDAKLESLKLSRVGVLAVRDEAYRQAKDVSPLMPTNAPGTTSYMNGVKELRNQFMSSDWELYRHAGVEGICSPEKDKRVLYQNVDKAASYSQSPKPRSQKGPATENECQGNLFDHSQVDAPIQFKVPNAGDEVWCVMVDDRGAVEVSRPVVKNGSFIGFVCRIIVSDGSELDSSQLPEDTVENPIDSFDVVISKK